MTISNECEPSLPWATNPVRSSAQFIAQHSIDVRISETGIARAAQGIATRLRSQEYSCATWKTHPLNPKTCDAQAIEWIFLIDLLNFSFWSDQPRSEDQYTVLYKGRKYQGYWSLCAAINRALDEGYPCTSAQFMVSASDATWTHIFRSETSEPIPLMAQRLHHVREAGQVLQRLYHGSFVHCVTAANHQALVLLSLITRDFASFRDEAHFHGRPVQFYKRAQILIADIWACCEGQELGYFPDIDEITMFADYRVPQALLYFGVLEYSPELLKLLRNPTTRLAPGSRREVEIRGVSIWAVERVCQCIRDKWSTVPGMTSVPVNPVLIDFYLWDLAKDHQEEMAHIPIHLTRSPFY